MPGNGIKILGQVVGGFQFHPGPAVPQAPRSLPHEANPGSEPSLEASPRAESREKGTEQAQMGLDGS